MELQLEEGKYYRTRSGEKVGPMRKDTDFDDIWDEGDDDRGNEYHWHGDGSRGAASIAKDIIAEWQEEPEHIGAFVHANAQALLCQAVMHLITDGEYSRAIAVLQILEGMDE